MEYSGAELIIKLLENQDVKVIAGIPGSANLPIYCALKNSKIKHVLARHEQGAGFIAQGIARTSGKVAVAFATSGPGATNILTALADAKLDSVPIIIITGQVASSMIGTDAFQEVDTYGMTIPISKHNFIIKSAEELLSIIPAAFSIASSCRPGPVVIDIPKDIQLEKVIVNEWPNAGKPLEICENDHVGNNIDEISALINKSIKPIIYAGGGIINAGASEKLLSVAEKNSIPITTTLNGLGTIPYEHQLNIGMLGMHAERYTNMAIYKADLIIAIGCRFDDRAVGKISEFCPDATIIHIDIDYAEISKNIKADYFIVGDALNILTEVENKIEKRHRNEWLNEISELKKNNPSRKRTDKVLDPHNLIKLASKLLPDDAIIATDVGQHQMWVAQAYPFKKPRTLLTSGGLGTMGIGLPISIGACIENPDKKVVCFSGDGSILMNIQELATAAELNCNLTVLIFKNKYLGLIKQQQELLYDATYFACKFDKNPDFVTIAKGFGIEGIEIPENITSEDLEGVLNYAFQSKKPMILSVPIEYTANVYPMVPPGAGNTTMFLGE